MTRPPLVTARLELRPLTAEHNDLLVELDSDPEVMRFLTGRAGTRAEVEARLAGRTDPAQDARGLGFWAAFAGEEFLGWVFLTPWRDEPDAGELGYRLRRTAWGHGYASEAAAALLDHGCWNGSACGATTRCSVSGTSWCPGGSAARSSTGPCGRVAG